MRFVIERSRETVLHDHSVSGRSVLPTVLGLDLMLRSAPGAGTNLSRLAVSGVRVGPPILLEPDERARAVVTNHEASGEGWWTSEVRSGHDGVTHFAARLTAAPPTLGADQCGVCARAVLPETDFPVGSEQVYPPFFHGPIFQVVAGLRTEADGVVAAYQAPQRLRWSFGELVYPAALLELAMQSCGLWDLADSGRMTIPASIESVTWAPAPLDPSERTVAHAVPSPASTDGQRTFDVHVAASGRTLMRVAGYRTADLGLTPDPAAARVLRSLLARTNRHDPHRSNVLAEGARS